jgi:predicted nucleotide-binding protein
MMPVEIVRSGNVPSDTVDAVIRHANDLQTEFAFILLDDATSASFRQHAYRQVVAEQFLDIMQGYRDNLRGFHPFVIAFIDSTIDGTRFSNLFGSHRAEKGLAVATISNVPDLIVPASRLSAYFMYYLARYTLSFISPGHRNHDDSRECVFDRKINKQDLLKSMKARALCDDCRRALLTSPSSMSSLQLHALDTLFDSARSLLAGEGRNDSRPAAFIGSSTEGLPIANKIQAALEYDLECIVWNQGTVFGLGDATLESLEAAVKQYDFGIFVFTPDDSLQTRGETKLVARDNVIFELGLFIGQLGRRKAFVVHPRKGAVSLPSDLHGIATATYDPSQNNIAAAIGPACEKIRAAVARAT